MSSGQSSHPFATRFFSSGTPGAAFEYDLRIYLDDLYKENFCERLAAEYPGRDVVYNLLLFYADTAQTIFWKQDDHYDEALRAFSVLVGHIAETDLDLDDLFYVFDIIEGFFDYEQEGEGPDHLPWLRQSVHALSGLFQEERYRKAIEAALDDKSRADFVYLISIAGWFYGADEFDLYMSFVTGRPDLVLSNARYWLLNVSDEQCRRFIAWARSCLPPEQLSGPLSRTQEYTKTQKAILDVVISEWVHILRSPQDRRDFMAWGLRSADKFKAAEAAYMLEDFPVSEWPEGSRAIVEELFSEMQPHWLSYKGSRGKGAYVKSKDRLGDLLEKVKGAGS
jgi:hypothetical protein